LPGFLGLHGPQGFPIWCIRSY